MFVTFAAACSIIDASPQPLDQHGGHERGGVGLVEPYGVGLHARFRVQGGEGGSRRQQVELPLGALEARPAAIVVAAIERDARARDRREEARERATSARTGRRRGR